MNVLLTDEEKERNKCVYNTIFRSPFHKDFRNILKFIKSIDYNDDNRNLLKKLLPSCSGLSTEKLFSLCFPPTLLIPLTNHPAFLSLGNCRIISQQAYPHSHHPIDRVDGLNEVLATLVDRFGDNSFNSSWKNSKSSIFPLPYEEIGHPFLPINYSFQNLLSDDSETSKNLDKSNYFYFPPFTNYRERFSSLHSILPSSLVFFLSCSQPPHIIPSFNNYIRSLVMKFKKNTCGSDDRLKIEEMFSPIKITTYMKEVGINVFDKKGRNPSRIIKIENNYLCDSFLTLKSLLVNENYSRTNIENGGDFSQSSTKVISDPNNSINLKSLFFNSSKPPFNPNDKLLSNNSSSSNKFSSPSLSSKNNFMLLLQELRILLGSSGLFVSLLLLFFYYYLFLF
jgi:hypothetical protein